MTASTDLPPVTSHRGDEDWTEKPYKYAPELAQWAEETRRALIRLAERETTQSRWSRVPLLPHPGTRYQ